MKKETLFDAVLKREDGDLVAVRYGKREYTYKKAGTLIRKLAAYLRAEGVKKGDTVTVCLPNIPVAVWLFYALDYIGARQNIIHPLTPALGVIKSMETVGSRFAVLLATVQKENAEIFGKSGYKFAFANPAKDASFIMKLAFFLKYGKIKETANNRLIDRYKKYKPDFFRDSLESGDTSVYLSSGGTFGDPKIIELSAFSINELVKKADGIISVPMEGKSMLAVLPMFHGFGLGMGIHTPIYNGASASVMPKFDLDKVVKLINANKLHAIIGVPLLYDKLLSSEKFLKSELKNLLYCFVGGDDVRIGLITEFNDVMKKAGSGCRLLEGYGLTETVTVCSVNTKENFRLGSVGKPLRGIEIKIIKENGEEAAANETGEVYISGDTLMNGYFGDEEGTKKTLVSKFGKTWIKTRDAGFLDDDGYLFLKGRMRRTFKISGVNVFPTEIEKIAAGVEGVYEAALEFFPDPKPHGTLFLVKRRDSRRSEDEIRAEVEETVGRQVVKYAVPERIIFKEKFPKTGIGKIDHTGLKE
ncbi:MAG TPA: hypothetical protein DDW54_03305 [Clostridiales bacterium]|nr:hypothetical protein [Clostridiales bacterium]